MPLYFFLQCPSLIMVNYFLIHIVIRFFVLVTHWMCQKVLNYQIYLLIVKIFYTGQLFWDHAKFKTVYQTRHQVQLRDCFILGLI